MKAEEILSYCNRIGPAIQKGLGLERFKIKYIATEIPDDEDAKLTLNAMVRILPHYEKAHIFLSPSQIDSETELYRLLRHEMLHVLLSPFEEAEAMIDDLVPNSQSAFIRKAMEIASERTVLALERTALVDNAMQRNITVNGLESTTKRPNRR